MEGIQIGAAIGLTLSVLYLLHIIRRLVRIGLTEYSGAGAFLRNCFLPMTSTAGICLLSASFIAYPLWASQAVGQVMSKVPADMVPTVTTFSPIAVFLVGIIFVVKMIRSA